MSLDDFTETARGLFTLEINTVLKDGMSAQKMPAAAQAMVDLAQGYHMFLCKRARDFGEPQHRLPDWANALSRNIEWGTDPFVQPDGEPRQIVTDAAPADPNFLTRPTHTIDAEYETLREVASWLREMREKTRRLADAPVGLDADALASLAAVAKKLDVEHDAVLFRIQRTSDQIKDFSAYQAKARVVPRASITRADDVRLEQNELVVLRKAWDVGTELVVMQTVIQIDGDVITRVVPSRASAAHVRIHELHRDAVDVSFRHWRTLVATVAKMADTVFKTLLNGRPG